MKVQLLTKKNGFYAGQEEIVALLKIIPEENKATMKKKIKKNLSFVIDKSGSMGGYVNNKWANLLGNGILGGNNLQPFNPQPVAPIYPNFPDNNPFAPTLMMTNGVANGAVHDKQQQNQLKDYLKQMQGAPVVQEKKIAQEKPYTRFELVIEATKEAVSRLDDEDFASVVLFGDDVMVLCPAMPMNKENKAMFISALNGAKLGGMTNLHGGWVAGVSEVAKNFSSEYINRVILLTDGETNVGETNPDVIGSNVAGAYKHSVTTSTIGVGEGFNEDLLQGMATAGAGNSYFIDNEASVKRTFDTEFTGLSNISAKEIKVKFEGTGSLKLVKNMNLFQQEDGYFKFPTLSSQEINAVFILQADKGVKKSLNTIKVSISYKDSNGKSKKIKIEEGMDLLPKKTVEDLPENEEVKVQELLNTIAEHKLQAQRAYKSGNISGATDLLARSAMVTATVASAFAPDSAYSAMLNTEAQNLNSLKDSASIAGDETFAKNLSYQAYRTRNAQDKDN